jgi:hypothetical protein
MKKKEGGREGEREKERERESLPLKIYIKRNL